MNASLAKNAVHKAFLESGLSSYLAGSINRAKVLMYHGVTSSFAKNFEAQIRYLAAAFKIVPLSALLADVREPNRNIGKLVALTFDDGLRNNFQIAYPILQRYKAPATFYVCPALVDESKWLWNHEVRARLASLSETARQQLAGELSAQGSAVEEIVNWMKSLPVSQREQVEDRIRRATGSFTPTAEQREKFDMMSWSEMTQLDPSIVTIGSHTNNHPILPSLTPDDIESQLRSSRERLEAALQREVPHFAYPNGDYNDAALQSTKRHYRSAVTTEIKLVEANCDEHQVPRIPAAMNLPLLAWRMFRPDA